MLVDKQKQTKRKLLNDSDSDSDSEGGGVGLATGGFKVNEEFARRFEHNKKREERQKLEEKYKKDAARRGGDESDDSSSSNETEDDDGFLATEDLDAQISATLNAIRNKDPRVYDKDATFYEENVDGDNAAKKGKKDKAVFLKDYHRDKIMRGDIGASDDEEETPQTYVQEQDALKESILNEIKATGEGSDSDSASDGSDGEGFMKRKEPVKAASNGVHPSRAPKVEVVQLDVTNANKNPETFLSNFLASRAWIPDDGPKWQAFESDDEEDNGRAEEFEHAYNMRFEDPQKSNEVLKSYARDVAAARSVRREEKSSRKRQRELEKEQKAAEKQERKEEKARLRKLKLEETEDKLRKVKEAAGAMGKTLTDEEWIRFLNEAWEDDKWEDEMQKRYGDEYYALDDNNDNEDEEGGKKKHKKPKKPTWDDDIDIKDLVPDFEDEDAKPTITLSDIDDEAGEGGDTEDADDDEDGASRPSKKRKTANHKRERIEKKKQARQERSRLEALVDSKLELTNHDLLQANGDNGDAIIPGSAPTTLGPVVGFRYRETSPQAFGMTARDILLAPSDQALNEYVGLKKLATFRDVDKKRRDKKHFGKKARLRNWRRDVFGKEFERDGPTYGFERIAGNGADASTEVNIKRTKKRGSKADNDSRGNRGGDAVGDDGVANGDATRSKRKRKRSKGVEA